VDLAALQPMEVLLPRWRRGEAVASGRWRGLADPWSLIDAVLSVTAGDLQQGVAREWLLCIPLDSTSFVSYSAI
jgi:hypothetical protein